MQIAGDIRRKISVNLAFVILNLTLVILSLSEVSSFNKSMAREIL
ncbi:hypothetical protein [Helicobacter cinaedi]|uniref:Uncharacterized protein n=1 Tax=Helicobacter cinaedi CCUG 18818 = ATCC BAA-847 TaxID=537971 RepID=A0ABN0BC20_9HELI|nr:hypothetical protein [Helicobacter cinaedi]EFR47034.1 hypothetical protein HCCG_01582 [Helicobacter cinaedi CCUG 18818 = ATCC BAA-847]BBB19604.1 hypothetical protein HC081234_07810 [Helicobacter cinaedi]